ncbi:MAG: PQQ-dependent sugar dehydrogenase [Streptosporangiaceae bacterium]
MPRSSRRGGLCAAALSLCLVLAAAGCTGGSGPAGGGGTHVSSATPTPGKSGAAASAPTPKVVDTIAKGLKVPWGLAFLPDGSALVSERDSARILRVTPHGKVTEVGTLPSVVPGGEGGQLDLAVSPHFASDHLVYAYYTAADDNRIVRMTYQNGKLGSPDPVLTGIPKGTIHNGGRIVFGPDGMLYASTGETGDGELAQNKQSLGGKILRITPEGAVPPDNPFPNSPVYSYGHRNVEGLAFDSRDRLWAAEFGESTWDELNLIRPGGNYGWPVVEGSSDNDKFINPVWQWHPAKASPSGIAIVDDVVYIACLRGERVWQASITGDHVTTPRPFFTGEYGRLRTIAEAPDGSLWLTTSNRDGRGDPHPGDDKILRVALR